MNAKVAPWGNPPLDAAEAELRARAERCHGFSKSLVEFMHLEASARGLSAAEAATAIVIVMAAWLAASKGSKTSDSEMISDTVRMFREELERNIAKMDARNALFGRLF